MLEPRRLTQKFAFSGRDFLGRKTKAMFRPSGSRNWMIASNEPTELSPHLLFLGSSCLVLRRGNSQDPIVIPEHILALRHAVLGVKWYPESSQVPYEGGAKDFSAGLFAASEISNEPIPTYTVSRELEHVVEERKFRRAVRIRPHVGEHGLILQVHIRYSFGEATHVYHVWEDGVFERLVRARPLGKLAWLSRLPLKLSGWPHYEQVIWPAQEIKRVGTEAVLEEICAHRALDMLGALSFLCKDGLFVGRVESEYGGHSLDVPLVEEAYQFLVPVVS